MQPARRGGRRARARGELRSGLGRRRRFFRPGQARGRELAPRHHQPALVRRVPVQPPAREDALRPFAQEVALALGPGVEVAFLDQEPWLGFAGLALHAHQCPAAGQFFASQAELQVTLAVTRLGIAHRRPGAAVPDDDLAGAVLALRDLAFEIGVVERVVLDVHRQPAHARVQAGSLGHRPTLEHLAELQAQVIMQSPGVVLLDHEEIAGRADGLAARFGRDREVAFLVIGL